MKPEMGMRKIKGGMNDKNGASKKTKGWMSNKDEHAKE